ncbi:MAG: hypothetical protein HYZ13_09405 [Acidobacteria bacterium]|nr:hypothetical protein [Acidobacteriota bacterium]
MHLPKLNLRTFLWVTICSVVSLMGWLGYDYARGPEDWRAWKKAREAKGETFKWSELAPPPIPDEENFAMAFVVRESMVGSNASPGMKALDLGKDRLPATNEWLKGHKLVLPDARGPEGQALVRDLGARAADFTRLIEAIALPGCRIPVAYAEAEVPSLLGFRAAIRALEARALLRLRSGDHAGAAADALAGLRLSWHLRREPSLLPHLLSMAIVRISMQVIWEGLVDHSWIESELKAFEEQLSILDLLDSGHRAFEGERMFAVAIFEAMAEGRPVPKGYQIKGGTESKRIPFLARPWVYQNLLEMDRFISTCYLDAIDARHHRIHPELADLALRWPERLRRKPHLIMARVALPSLGEQVARIAETQTRLDLARVACALERHRISKGVLPDGLDALSPGFMVSLPADVMSGGPLRYKRNGKGYQLYSLGWDTLDQGGIPAPPPGKEETLPGPGDWVWFSEVQP